jgi:hypothetical protein
MLLNKRRRDKNKLHIKVTMEIFISYSLILRREKEEELQLHEVKSE